jgi:hypothetical protein
MSLTTTGSSGASTLNTTTGVLNIPNYAGGGGSSTIPVFEQLDTDTTVTTTPAYYEFTTTAQRILTFPAAPSDGDWFYASQASGVVDTLLIDGNGAGVVDYVSVTDVTDTGISPGKGYIFIYSSASSLWYGLPYIINTIPITAVTSTSTISSFPSHALASLASSSQTITLDASTASDGAYAYISVYGTSPNPVLVTSSSGINNIATGTTFSGIIAIGETWFFSYYSVGDTWEAIKIGAIGGSTGATTDAVIVANGTGGSTIQATPVIINHTSGNISGAGTIRSGNASPTTDDGAALGTTSLKWSDLFLASGAVINFNSGDVTITHSTDLLTFDNAANGFTFNQPTAGNPIITLQTTATNDDPSDVFKGYRVATTNGTATTIATVAIPSSTIVGIDCKITARRTGGTAGTAEDGAYYTAYQAYKNVSGTATILATAVKPVVIESQAGWDITFSASGANALVQVTGATNNNVTWHAICAMTNVGS